MIYMVRNRANKFVAAAAIPRFAFHFLALLIARDEDICLMGTYVLVLRMREPDLDYQASMSSLESCLLYTSPSPRD